MHWCDKANDECFSSSPVPWHPVYWIRTKAVCEDKEKKKTETFAARGEGRKTHEETNWGGLQDRCSPQGEPALTRLPHKLFCSFRLHSKVVELGYKIISQATCLSSLAVQLANWREWFPVWVTVQNMAVKIWMILIPHFPSFSFNIWNILLVHRQKKKLLARGIRKKKSDWQFLKLINKTSEDKTRSLSGI